LPHAVNLPMINAGNKHQLCPLVMATAQAAIY
jgi:hypothetical protein